MREQNYHLHVYDSQFKSTTETRMILGYRNVTKKDIIHEGEMMYYNFLDVIVGYSWLNIIKLWPKSVIEHDIVNALKHSVSHNRTNETIYLLSIVSKITFNKYLNEDLLIIASTLGNLTIVNTLYEYESNLPFTFALIRAIENDHLNIVEYLLERNPDYQDKEHQNNIFDYSCIYGRLRILKYFIKIGQPIPTDIDVRDSGFCNAVDSGNSDFVKFLIKQGFQPTSSSVINYLARGDTEMATYLFQHGVDPAKIAIADLRLYEENLHTIRYALDNLTYNKDDLFRLIHIAIRAENIDIIDLLLTRGAKIPTSDEINLLLSNDMNFIEYLLRKEPSFINQLDRYELKRAIEQENLYVVKEILNNKLQLDDKYIATIRFSNPEMRELVKTYARENKV
jgi:ankyrin repeat protein